MISIRRASTDDGNMTAPEATDAIERCLTSLAAGPRCALGVAGLVVGGAAALFVSRRLLPNAPEASRAEAPRSFRLALLPALAVVWLAATFLAILIFANRKEADGATRDLRAEIRALWFVAAVVVVFLVVWVRRLGDGVTDLGVTGRALGRTLLATLVFYVACFPAQIGAAALESGVCELLGRTPATQAAVLAFARDPTLFADPVVVGAIVLAAPLYEELLFRGVLLRFLLRAAPAAIAIALDAAAFMLVHGGGYAAVFVLGAALAWLMAKTRSLAAPLCFHVVHNGLALFLIATTAG